jgi:hypothetical protein
LIKRKLIANNTEEFFHPFLTQVKSRYPILPIQTYPKVAMSSASSPGLFLPTNIGRFPNWTLDKQRRKTGEINLHTNPAQLMIVRLLVLDNDNQANGRGRRRAALSSSP